MSNTYHHLSSEERAVVMLKCQEHCSMRAIARMLHRPVSTISRETIYAAIYAQPRGALKHGMTQSLRQAKSRRGVRCTTAVARSFVPKNQRIAHRPEDIERRLVPGHWEGDFIKGAYNRSAVLFSRFFTVWRAAPAHAQGI